MPKSTLSVVIKVTAQFCNFDFKASSTLEQGNEWRMVNRRNALFVHYEK